MQNAMNNMMSNSSQLHSMLHGHQSPSLPMEASDASSTSSSSSASESPSCSNPSSPQCPQDSESVVSMDTNSSSASSCASDSGEDEAVVTTSTQHQDAFAFGQQRSSPRQSQASPVAVSQEAGCDSRMEEQQESWNSWNNNVVVGGYQHSSYSNGQRVSNTAYREERGVSQQQQQQQLGGVPSSEPTEGSQRRPDFNAQTASSGYMGPAGCGNHKAHLVSFVLFCFF